MPRNIEYPRAPFTKALELAKAVDALGGDCSADTCADKMHYSGGGKNGAFQALVSAAAKHQLINSKASLTISELYKNIILSYNDEEKREYLQIAFLYAPLYRKIYEKFKGKELPISILEKMLVRDFAVDKNMASRVGGYIVEGAKYVGLLIDNKLVENIRTEEVEVLTDKSELKEQKRGDSIKGELISYQEIPIQASNSDKREFSPNSYVVHITGPGMNTWQEMTDEDDFTIIAANLQKLKKKLGVT